MLLISTPTILLRAAIVAFIATTAPAQQKPSNLDTILHQLDLASANFRSAQADMRRDGYAKVVKETTTQCGVIYFERKGTALEMGAKVAPSPTQSCSGDAAATASGTRTLAYKGGELQMFEPALNHLTLLHAGSNQAQYESFLTLGFGGSGRDLARTWEITDQGTEVVRDGAKSITTAKLDLVARDPANRNMFSHITIWVDPVQGITYKQLFFTPSGDFYTTWYDHVRYNQKIPESAFAIKTDKQTTVDRR
jgi:outer membrane lipoprotein-sorting protein